MSTPRPASAVRHLVGALSLATLTPLAAGARPLGRSWGQALEKLAAHAACEPPCAALDAAGRSLNQLRPPSPPFPPPLPPPPVLVGLPPANDTLADGTIVGFAIPSGIIFLIAVFVCWRFVAARWAERTAAIARHKQNMSLAMGEWRGRTSEWDEAPAMAPHGFGPASPGLDRTKHHVPTFLGEPPTSPLAGGWAAGELLNDPPKGVRVGSI